MITDRLGTLRAGRATAAEPRQTAGSVSAGPLSVDSLLESVVWEQTVGSSGPLSVDCLLESVVWEQTVGSAPLVDSPWTVCWSL